MNASVSLIRKFFPDNIIIFLDTEFNHPEEKNMGLLCLCAEEWVPGKEPRKISWWVSGDATDRESAIRFFENRKGALIVAHSIVAEFESLIALGLRPLDYLGACTYLEALQLQNSWDRHSYGYYLDDLGIVRKSIPPKIQISKHMSEEEEREANEENEFARKEWGADSVSEWNPNLLNCLLNFSGIPHSEILDHYSTKTDTRKLILSKDSFDSDERKQIVDYCRLDVDVLPDLFAGELARMEQCLGSRHAARIAEYVTNRGRRAAHTAKQQRIGIPINGDRYRNLCLNSYEVTQNLKLEWNVNEFPYYRDDTKETAPAGAWRKLVADQKALDAWVLSMPDLAKRWPKSSRGFSTDSKLLSKLSVSEDDCVGRFLRHRKEVKTLEFYSPMNLDPEFLHQEKLANLDRSKPKMYVGFYVGSDMRMRPHLNPYGAQTGRNGHKAVGFIPAQGKVLRALIDPGEGSAITECDYSAEEDLIPASPTLSGDDFVLKAYRAGDPYLAFAALTGKCDLERVSWWVDHRHDQSSLTAEEKAEHKTLSKYRKDAKPQKLGTGFGMKAPSLARHMNGTVEQARAVLDAYWKRVHKYKAFRDRIEDRYKMGDCVLVLQNGWAIGPDNRNVLSVQNFPIQGTGVVILERCLDILETIPQFADGRWELLCTVHDAFMIRSPKHEAEEAKNALLGAMLQASKDVLLLDDMRAGSETLEHGELWCHDVDPAKFEKWKPYFLSAPDVNKFL